MSAIEYFKQAIAIDPNYAFAHVGYADAYGVGSAYGFYSGKTVMKEIKRAVDAALGLDPTHFRFWQINEKGLVYSHFEFPLHHSFVGSKGQVIMRPNFYLT